MNQYHVLQDWKDFDDSLIFELSDLYYEAQGLNAFSSRSGAFVPSEVSNSYPHARSIIEVCKTIIENNNLKNFKILELGSGTGIFARHLLLAARDLGLSNKIKVYLSEKQEKSLQQIIENQVLDDFVRGDDFEIIKLDIFQINEAMILDKNKIELKNFDAILMNYVYDAMPMLPLRYQDNKYQKLQIRLLQEDKGQKLYTTIQVDDLIQDSNLINKLLIDERWIDFEAKSDLQKQYSEFLNPRLIDHRDLILFSYGAMYISEQALKMCNDNGFICSCDMPSDPLDKSFFKVFGNAVANFFNEALITQFMHEKYQAQNFVAQDCVFQKMFYFKNSQIFENCKSSLEKFFIENSLLDIYMDLRQAINSISSKHSRNIVRFLAEELIKIDPHSCPSLIAQGKILEMDGKSLEAKIIFDKARKLNFLGNFKI